MDATPRKVLLTGATGYAGGVALDHLVAAGHEVIAVVRPHHLPTLASRPNVTWVPGDFANPSVFFELAKLCDATLHIGAAHSVEIEEMARLDGQVIRAIGDALAGTGKVFINTSAAALYGDTGPTPRDESEPVAAPLPVRAWRYQHDCETVAMRDRGLRSVVVRPGYIYGRGAGVLARQIRQAKSSGRALYIGDGARLTTTIDVDALARLYLAVLHDDAAHGVFNAGSDEVVRARDLAKAIAAVHGPGIEAVSWSLEAARPKLGAMADIAAISTVILSDRARTLGWSPTAPSLMSELVVGSYAPPA